MTSRLARVQRTASRVSNVTIGRRARTVCGARATQERAAHAASAKHRRNPVASTAEDGSARCACFMTFSIRSRVSTSPRPVARKATAHVAAKRMAARCRNHTVAAMAAPAASTATC
jgi:hypothetical protein